MASVTELLSLVNTARRAAEGEHPELVQQVQSSLKDVGRAHLEAARVPAEGVGENNLERLAEHLLALETLEAAGKKQGGPASGSNSDNRESATVVEDPVIREGGIIITLAGNMPPMTRKSVRPWVESQAPQNLLSRLTKTIALPGGKKVRQDFENVTESELEALKAAFVQSGTVARAPPPPEEFAKRKAYETEHGANKRSRASAVGNLGRALDVVESVSNSGDHEFMRLAMSAVVTSQRVAAHGLRELAEDPLARNRDNEDM
ncbi:unnamed protein product [Prorocentrum cordatum]|uniref:Uncharacterized protein n=1 Tax=Prorocentrum cordatum TaxID=2364126 RepID=A0ABN9W0U2_9DINO|nr:unnamed protein product [Polarella glacialis]